MQPFVQITHLTKTFSPETPPALDEIQAEFHKGQMVGLVGPDGAGKTTLLRLIATLLLPDQGQITIGGLDTVNEAEKIHEMMGYMPQRFGLYEELSVIENLDLYANLRGIDRREKESVFDKLLTFTRLHPFQKRAAKALSGGMKQKLGLACALIKKPQLLLLDEPGVGVDPISRRELWDMVQSLIDESICVIWSTAYLDEAEKCDTVLLLNEGKLHFAGKPAELTKQVQGRVFCLRSPDQKRVTLRKMMDRDNVVDAMIEGNDIRLVLKEPEDYETVPPRFEDAFVDILSKAQDKQPMSTEAPYIANHSVEFPIDVRQLTKKYGDFIAADQITFQVKKGEIFGLLGPNGAGKSTTFKMLCSLLKPTEGLALINGVDTTQSAVDARAHIGYMAQKFSLYGNLSVIRNLDFFASVYHLKGAQKAHAIERLIALLDLNEVEDRICDTLPIGYKQRVAFAAATMHSPQVLFLDEPTSGMDPLTRRAFWRQINALAEAGCTIMVTTHFMDEAENCDRIALLYQSKMIYLGTGDALKEQVKSDAMPNPTLDDAFVRLIAEHHEK